MNQEIPAMRPWTSTLEAIFRSSGRPLDWTFSWALPWTPSWDVLWELSWRLNVREINPRGSCRGRCRGRSRGAFVGPLVGPLVVPLVDPLVGRGSLSPALCVAQYRCNRGEFRLGRCTNPRLTIAMLNMVFVGVVYGSTKLGDKFGESLGGSQAPPSFWEVPGLPRKFPKLPQKFFGDFPGSSLTVELYSNPGVPRKFPKLPRKFPKLPRRSALTSPEVSPFSGKPDTLSWLAKTSLKARNPEDPKIETFQDFHPGLKFSSQVSKPSIENEIFKLATQQGPWLWGIFRGRDGNFQARMNFSSANEIFMRKGWDIQAFKREWSFSRFVSLGK